MSMNNDIIIEQVKDYYGKILQSTKDLKTSACCTEGKPPAPILNALRLVPRQVMERYYGCGNPIPLGIEGLTLMDLGCGTGRDCYIAAQLVGPRGRVIGVDMTDEQLRVARDSLGEFHAAVGGRDQCATIEFKTGYIEMLEEGPLIIPKQSVDIVISNCVVNLSPRKDLVLHSVYNVLREGGEFHFSDVYCDRRLPDAARKHQLLWGECIAGAMYVEDFKQLARQVGFKDPRVLSIREISVEQEFQAVLGAAKFYSITFRLFKLQELEERCEDYGQVASYLGGLEGTPSPLYQLDGGHVFEKGRPVLVCGNTAAMLSKSWLKRYFKVDGDTSTHYGLFACSKIGDSSGGGESGGKCSEGSCC